jgi:hypothetical protein
MRSGRTQQKQIGRLLLKGQQAKSKTQPKPERESATRLPPHFREEETLFQFTYNSKSPSVSKVSANGITATIPIAMDGEVSRADAPACFSLYNLQQARLTLDAAHRDFLKKAVPLGATLEAAYRTGARNRPLAECGVALQPSLIHPR